MEASHLVFVTNDVTNDDESTAPYSIDVSEDNQADLLPNEMKPTCFIAGDLAFLAIIMGKEGFASSWCNWCDLDRNAWAIKGHADGELWTRERILQQHLANEANKWDDERRRGIRRETPYTIFHSAVTYSLYCML
jgi:hypothetical protein